MGAVGTRHREGSGTQGREKVPPVVRTPGPCLRRSRGRLNRRKPQKCGRKSLRTDSKGLCLPRESGFYTEAIQRPWSRFVPPLKECDIGAVLWGEDAGRDARHGRGSAAAGSGDPSRACRRSTAEAGWWDSADTLQGHHKTPGTIHML